MMMVSSAKLRKTEQIIENLYPYEQKLSQLLHILLNEEIEVISPFTTQRPIQRVAIVVFSSNLSLAGRFNHNIADKLETVVKSYRSLGKENIVVYPIGEKVTKAALNLGLQIQGHYEDISEKPTYEAMQKIAGELMELFLTGTIDRVELIYHHFRSKSTQVVMRETFLPLELKVDKPTEPALDYIVEPDTETVLSLLIPKTLKLQLYTAHVDSVTSEHAARMVAMQIATDNADDLLEDLTMEYNKLRQQSITNELLDILGSSFVKGGS